MIHRRSAIKPAIGHMKKDGRLERNPLEGALGDALHAVMYGAGHNLHLILAKLRLPYAQFGITLAALAGCVRAANAAHSRLETELFRAD